MTNSMIEISTGICHSSSEVLGQLSQIRDALVRSADKLNIAVVGGGTHPFQQWHERRIYDKPRFQELSQLYGYLSKQFTILASMCTSVAPTPMPPADAAPHVALHPALHRARHPAPMCRARTRPSTRHGSIRCSPSRCRAVRPAC